MRSHRRARALHPLANGYACGNLALSGGTAGVFDDLGTEHAVPLTWIIDPFGQNSLPVYYNHNGVDPGRAARTRDGNVYTFRGQYRYSIADGTADDHAPIFNFVPNVIADNSRIPNHAYSLSLIERRTLQTLWDAACREPLIWKKQRRRRGAVVVTTEAETTSDWGDRLQPLGPDALLIEAEKRTLRNEGPLSNSAGMRFFHKLMKRLAELYGWRIRKYKHAPGRFGGTDGVGIAVASCSWWAADHFGFVVTNAVNPSGTLMPYAFFQTVPTMNGDLMCYSKRLLDLGRAVTVLWIESVPRLVLEKLRDHYY
jgi:hypothetical protein